jgi:hypothetical protein
VAIVGRVNYITLAEDIGHIGHRMDSRELQEIHRVLISHEEHIHYNKSSIFNLASKIHKIDVILQHR